MKLLFYVTLCFMTGFSACKGEPSTKSDKDREQESKIKPPYINQLRMCAEGNG